jgi:hypothetical protein
MLTLLTSIVATALLAQPRIPSSYRKSWLTLLKCHADAELTGGLEHPGVVPVYGLGTYGDGRPYYPMRFIRADSLKEAIEHWPRRSIGRRADNRSIVIGLI